ncbi:exp1-like protein [Serendipita sp. 396]|nr:exp1-like protein [Serendipita sp. 396]KAG8789460.1 exp1-like protein [Serendipita sp. 397]
MPAQQLYLPRSSSQETLDAEDLVGSDHPPPSPPFDIDDFVSEPTSLHQMATATVSPIELTQGHISHHRDEHQTDPWTPWNVNIDVMQGISTNQMHSTPSYPPSMIQNTTGALGSYGSHHPVGLKTQEAMFNTPQSILTSLYSSPQHSQPFGGFGVPPQAGPYLPATGTISDYELALSGAGMMIGNGTELFHMSTIDNQQMNGVHYHEVGKLPHGDSVYGPSHQSFYRSETPAYPLGPGPADGRDDQRRATYLPRRDSSVPPYSTEARNSQSKAFLAASAPTPSILSNLGAFSPVGSPRSVRGLSVSLSIAGSSPSIESASPRYGHPGSPMAPYAASPAQLSASPHQFTSNSSPVFASATPITFVNQTAQYSTSSAWPEDGQLSSSASSATDDSQSRKRRRRQQQRTVTDNYREEQPDEELPTKSELHPPKQAPSMWQVYFADWLQDHKTRYPHDKLNVAQAAKEAGQLYKTLTEAEREHLKRRVYQEKEARERRLSAWQRTLTPNDIKRENKFRAAQRKAGLSRRANIKDPNAPKKPLSAYFMFLAKIRSDSRLVDEVFGGETETTRQSVLAAQTWREMSDEEKRPFLTQAEHDKIQYEALRKIYEEQAGSGSSSSNTSTMRKQMAGTGYIVPQQMGISDDITAAILSAKPNGDSDEFRMVSYDPQATITNRKNASKASAVPIFSTTGTIRRRVRKATRYSIADSAPSSHSRGDEADSSMDSAESDDEWVPGKSI